MRRDEVLHGTDAQAARDKVGSASRPLVTKASALYALEDSADENWHRSGSESASVTPSGRRHRVGIRTERMAQ